MVLLLTKKKQIKIALNIINAFEGKFSFIIIYNERM